MDVSGYAEHLMESLDLASQAWFEVARFEGPGVAEAEAEYLAARQDLLLYVASLEKNQ